MFTALSQAEEVDGAIQSFARQGYGDSLHPIVVNVTDLAEKLRQMQAATGMGRLRLEHIHDYEALGVGLRGGAVGRDVDAGDGGDGCGAGRYRAVCRG
ncbi:hypothetical protein FIU86_07105 [Roseovarius sp. THAF9]|nr:hypothetical protein FIU86_07105 [Roseovarius sp. THAF9]